MRVAAAEFEGGGQAIDKIDRARLTDAADDFQMQHLLAEWGTSRLGLQVVRNDRNRGFVASCNRGAAVAKSDFLIFLNDGTGRFTIVLFPVFIAAAARLHSMRSVAVVCACFVPFLMLFLFQFARWRPVL